MNNSSVLEVFSMHADLLTFSPFLCSLYFLDFSPRNKRNTSILIPPFFSCCYGTVPASLCGAVSDGCCWNIPLWVREGGLHRHKCVVREQDYSVETVIPVWREKKRSILITQLSVYNIRQDATATDCDSHSHWDRLQEDRPASWRRERYVSVCLYTTLHIII